MNKTDSLKIYELENSIQELNQKIIEINNSSHILVSKHDSLTKTVNEFIISKEYFSDILSSQLGLFSLIVGGLGLLIGLSVWGYFKWKFKLLEEKIDFNGERDETADENLKELLNTKEVFLSQNIDNLKEDLKLSIEKNRDILQNIIEEQKIAYENEKDSLIHQINTTNFEACRSLYLFCHKEEDYLSAFSWIILILKHLIINKVESVEISDWVNYAVDDTTKMKYGNWISKNYNEVKKLIDEMIANTDQDDIISNLNKISFNIGKLYFDNLDASK